MLTPDEAAARPPASFDLIVMHSVAQYLTGAELDRLLGVFHRLIKPDGLVIVGDIVPPQLAAPAAAAGAAAVRPRQRILLGRGRRPDPDFRVGLFPAEEDARPVALPEAAMLERLKAAGYSAKRAARNIATISGA